LSSSPTRKLLDSSLRRRKLLGAKLVELLAALPQRRQLVDADVAPLETFDDLLELSLRLLERRAAHSTLAPNAPAAISTAISVPAGGGVRTTELPARTIA
jgi:hypothetical protein